MPDISKDRYYYNIFIYCGINHRCLYLKTDISISFYDISNKRNVTEAWKCSYNKIKYQFKQMVISSWIVPEKRNIL